MDRRTFFFGAAAAAHALGQNRGGVGLFDGRSLAGWVIEGGPETAFYVNGGAIVVHESGNYPAWLRSERQYENFDFRGEFYVKGWTDSGIYIHAPLHGRPTWEGIQLKLFHQPEPKPSSNSMGALFPLVAPRKVNVRNDGEWNTFRIRMEWPGMRVWTNDELIHDVNLEQLPEFYHRRRRGFLGLASLSYPIRFRALTVEELPGKEQWESLYTGPEDFGKWYVSEGKPHFEPIGEVLRGDGTGHLSTRAQYRDFELRTYIRGSKEHNGGVMFRTSGEGNKGARHYEIQLHNVEDAHFPTGSLYHFKRSRYVRIEPGAWFPFHLIVQRRNCTVRIDGETVMEFDALEDTAEGHIELQAHRVGYWTEFKDLRIKRL